MSRTGDNHGSGRRMDPELELTTSFPARRVLVLGEAMLDVYLRGRATRLCPEGPFPVVDIHARELAVGGAANVAANVAALGGDVSLVSVVGRDEAGAHITRIAAQAGVDTSGIMRHERRSTLTKTRVVGDDRTLVRFDSGSVDPLDAFTSRRAEGLIADRAAVADVVIVSDYRYGIVSDRMISLLSERNPDTRLVIDSKQPGRFGMAGADMITPNYREAIAAIGAEALHGSDRIAQAEELAPRFLDSTGATAAAITLDVDGVVVCDAGGVTHLPSLARGTDPCGAGDTFTAALALALAAGADAVDAARLAGRAAAVAVQRHGTAVCSLRDLRRELLPKWCADAGQVNEMLEPARSRGGRVVFTNGCFDVLHPGHITSLREAAAMGDVLVVAVNGDESVRRLKGPGRPANPLEDRVAVLSALSMVDHVVSFESVDPTALLAEIRPDVYCKGGDYAGRRIPEAQLVESWGGRFETTSYVEDKSTTSTLERVQSGQAAFVGGST